MDKKIIIEIKIDNEDLYKDFIPYFQTFNNSLNSIRIIPIITIRDNIKTTKSIIEELTAQSDTFMNLMNVYKDLSKGRKDAKSVIDYINELEIKSNEYEQALDYIKECIDELDWTMLEHTYKRINDIITKAKEK